jgi:hypothetical protein
MRALSASRQPGIITMTEIYIAGARENRIAEAIAALTPCPFHGASRLIRFKTVFGEVGDIWPASIKRDRRR